MGRASVRGCAAAGLLLLLAVVLLWPAVAHPTWWLWSPSAPHSDLAVTHWPNAHFTRRALWEERRFPLWRPTIMSGTPFAANPLAGLYYPPNWLFLFLPWWPLAVGFNLAALAHLWLAGLTMYGLLRRGFGAGTVGALTAAVAYEAAPKLLAHLGAGHVGWAAAWGWLPLAVLCWMQATAPAASSDERRRWGVLAGVVLAIQFLADVRLTVYTAMILAALSAVRRSLSAARYGLPVFLGLTACQWLPLLALLPDTTRAALTLHDAAVWSLPWRYLAGLLLADHGGFHEWMTYIGLVTLIAAVAGGRALWRRRDRRPWFWWLVGLAAGGLWFSLGENGGLFPLLYRVVPGLGLLRVPPRAWVLVVFAGAVLAGLGVEAGLPFSPLSLAGGVLPLFLLVGYRLFVGPAPLNLVMFGLLPLPTVFLLAAVRRPATGGRYGRLVLILLALDLTLVGRTLLTARPSEEVFAAGREAAAWLAAQPGAFRVYSPSYSLPQHVAERYGLLLADGVDPLQLRVYARYLTRAAGLSPSGYSVTLPPFPEGAEVDTALADVSPDAARLGNLGVRYVVAAFPLRPEPQFVLAAVTADAYIYRNQAAGPLVKQGMGIVLSDGTVLYRYDPRPVYLGGALSGATLVVLVGRRVAKREGRGRRRPRP